MARKRNLFLHGNDSSFAHKSTFEARWSDPRTKYSFSTTQVWSWNGGDAIVVVTGRFGEAWVVIRQGKTITFVPGSLHDAMLAIGLDPSAYRIVTKSQLEEERLGVNSHG